MRKFKVAIEETVVDEFTVEADSESEALEIARQKYRNGEFVLEPGEVQYKQMAVVSENENHEWREF